MYNQKIECCVTDCINCCNGTCQLNKILITNDIIDVIKNIIDKIVPVLPTIKPNTK